MADDDPMVGYLLHGGDLDETNNPDRDAFLAATKAALVDAGLTDFAGLLFNPLHSDVLPTLLSGVRLLLLAPTNEAMQKLPQGIRADPSSVRRLLKAHIKVHGAEEALIGPGGMEMAGETTHIVKPAVEDLSPFGPNGSATKFNKELMKRLKIKYEQEKAKREEEAQKAGKKKAGGSNDEEAAQKAGKKKAGGSNDVYVPMGEIQFKFEKEIKAAMEKEGWQRGERGDQPGPDPPPAHRRHEAKRHHEHRRRRGGQEHGRRRTSRPDYNQRPRSLL